MSASATITDVLAGRAQWAVVCADNRTAMASLPPGCVDHVITDPPYSEHVHGKQRRLAVGAGSKRRSEDGKGHVVVAAALGFESLDPVHRVLCAQNFGRIVKRWALVFSDLESTEAWLSDLVAGGMRRWRFGIWNKLNCQPQLSGTGPGAGSDGIAIAHSVKAMRWNGGGLPARWDFAIATDRNGNERVHTTQKPEPLMLRLVELFTDPGDLVLDPFAGSGTTGVACIRLNRRCILIERDEKYAAIARERLAAESRGLSLTAARAGQTSLFDVIGATK